MKNLHSPAVHGLQYVEHAVIIPQYQKYTLSKSISYPNVKNVVVGESDQWDTHVDVAIFLLYVLQKQKNIWSQHGIWKIL